MKNSNLWIVGNGFEKKFFDRLLTKDTLERYHVHQIDDLPESLELDDKNILLFPIKYLKEDSHKLFKAKESVFLYGFEEEINKFDSAAKDGFENIFLLPDDLSGLNANLKVPRLNGDKSDPTPKEESEKLFPKIIGSSESFLESLRLLKKVAANPKVNILILGETGTGKGLFAKTIHECSPKSSAPFVDINCSAIPINLLESELFGYEKGAYTDAKHGKIGLFELAENGTIFLDEIGDLGLEIQVKLLKALDDRVIRRLGGTKDIPVFARIISATNRDLEELVRHKMFRIDLLHRLNVITINIPPLRERAQDILELTEFFIKDFAGKFEKEITKVEAEAKDFILNYSWPGNVRELRNSLERAVLLSEDGIIRTKNLFMESPNTKILEGSDSQEIISLKLEYAKISLSELNKIYALKVLKKFNGNKSKTSRALGISRPKLDRLLNDY